MVKAPDQIRSTTMQIDLRRVRALHTFAAQPQERAARADSDLGQLPEWSLADLYTAQIGRASCRERVYVLV